MLLGLRHKYQPTWPDWARTSEWRLGMGGSRRGELNHADQSVLPQGFRNDSNDTRILSVALGLAAEGRDVTLVSKDMPLRVKAASVGLTADEYRHGQASDPTWVGMADLTLGEDQVNQLYA